MEINWIFLNIQVATTQCWWERSTRRDTASCGRLAGDTSAPSGWAGTWTPPPSRPWRWWRAPGTTPRQPSTRSNCWNPWVLLWKLIIFWWNIYFLIPVPDRDWHHYIVGNKLKENMRAVHGPWVKIPSRAISVFCWKILGNIKSILVIIKKNKASPDTTTTPPH